jgi:hypothetical protein
MARSDRKYLVVLMLVFGGAVAARVLAPEPLDWSPGFTRHATTPYGSRVLFDVLGRLFPGVPVRALDLPPYVVLQDTLQAAATYLFVTDAFAPDAAEAAELLAFAERGGTVFVAAHRLTGALADTLHLETDDLWFPDRPGGGFRPDTLDPINLVSPSLRRAEPYGLRAGTGRTYLARFDTARATVLGVDGDDRANYIRLPHGAGSFFVSTVPLVFTNYNLLEGGNAGYVAAALSYLPVQAVWWDEHHKPLRAATATPLRFVLAQPALRGAYLTAVVALLLFVAFHAKRRQRVIPVHPPLRNTTLDFVKTVGRLYYQHGDHANLAGKKVTFFLEYVRTHLRLPTHRLDEAFQAQVAERAGVPAERVQAVFAEIARVQGPAPVTEEALVRLSEAIERFHAARRP